MEKSQISSPTDFGKIIKSLRKQKGITQKNLADQSGVAQQTISALENGILDPSLKLLIVIAKLLEFKLLIDVQ